MLEPSGGFVGTLQKHSHTQKKRLFCATVIKTGISHLSNASLKRAKLYLWIGIRVANRICWSIYTVPSPWIS